MLLEIYCIGFVFTAFTLNKLLGKKTLLPRGCVEVATGLCFIWPLFWLVVLYLVYLGVKRYDKSDN